MDVLEEIRAFFHGSVDWVHNDGPSEGNGPRRKRRSAPLRRRPPSNGGGYPSPAFLRAWRSPGPGAAFNMAEGQAEVSFPASRGSVHPVVVRRDLDEEAMAAVALVGVALWNGESGACQPTGAARPEDARMAMRMCRSASSIGVWLDVGLEGHIIAPFVLFPEIGLSCPVKFPPAVPKICCCPYPHRMFPWPIHLGAAFVHGPAGKDLGRLDVGLVEGVQPRRLAARPRQFSRGKTGRRGRTIGPFPYGSRMARLRRQRVLFAVDHRPA